MSSISTTLKILEIVCSGKGGVTISQLARSISRSPSNVCYYLKVLQEEGYVYKEPHTGKYKASYKIVDLGSRILANNELHEVAHPVLLQLSEKAHLTVHLAIKDGNVGVCILKVGSSKTMPSISRIGETFDLYPTALGKVILAWMEEEELEAYLREVELKPYTPHTITDPGRLKQQLKEVRERGFSLDEHEHRIGVRGLGVPIFDYTHKVVGAISALLSPHHNHDDIVKIAQELKEASSEISKKLGYRGHR